MKKTVYIASPYTIGDKLENVRNQIEVANDLINSGFAPYVPTLSHFQDEIYPQSWETWMDLDYIWLSKCDCLLRFGGESKGAELEVAFAKEHNIPVFYSVSEVIKHFAEHVKKIIIVGRTCTGKTHKKNELIKKGYIPEVSYCTRELRVDEEDGFDYHKISKEQFEKYINEGFFIEYDKFGGEYYGTSKAEFERCNLFIMTPNGVKQLTPEQRAKCHVILMKCSYETAIKRMKERGWDFVRIANRFETDNKQFDNFTDYDEIINTD